MLGRVMPLLLLTGTVAVVTSEGPQTVAKVRDAVRAILQRSEVQDSAKLLRAELARGGEIPRPGRPEALAQFLHETKSAGSDRDVALDYWQHALVLEREDAESLLLLSLGSNGQRDACAKGGEDTADCDDICERIEVPRGSWHSALRP